jgi:DNA-binding NarL/FixJ family response regulator
MTTDDISVLLIEDDPTDAALFKALIGHTATFSQEHANSVASALVLLEHDPVDVVVLDLGLPDSSHDATYPTIRDAAPGVPVIVLTGHDDDEIALKALAQGAQDFLVKNDATEALLAKSIRYALERQRAITRQLSQRNHELEIYESLAPEATSRQQSSLADGEPDVFDVAVSVYGGLITLGSSGDYDANEAEVRVQIESLAAQLADHQAVPTDLAAIHTTALAGRQSSLDAIQFRVQEDVARLLLQRFTAALALHYHQRQQPAGEQREGALPADAHERLVSALHETLKDGPFDPLDLASLAQRADLPPAALAQGSMALREAMAGVVQAELARQREHASHVLDANLWTGLPLDQAATGIISALVDLWRIGRYVNLAAIGAGCASETFQELRYRHLRSLATSVVDCLAPHLDFDQAGRRRETELAVAELFAALDQKLTLGELYPKEQGRDEALAELTGLMLARLDPAGQLPASLPPPPPPDEVAGAAEPEDRDDAPAADDDALPRQATEADYSAWADRMRTRRRSSIDDTDG